MTIEPRDHYVITHSVTSDYMLCTEMSQAEGDGREEEEDRIGRDDEDIIRRELYSHFVLCWCRVF